MISFNLRCENEHEFEGWFKDSASFEKQQEMGLLECSVCGSNKVVKALSAPNISTSRTQEKSQMEIFAKTHTVKLLIGDFLKTIPFLFIMNYPNIQCLLKKNGKEHKNN